MSRAIVPARKTVKIGLHTTSNFNNEYNRSRKTWMGCEEGSDSVAITHAKFLSNRHQSKIKWAESQEAYLHVFFSIFRTPDGADRGSSPSLGWLRPSQSARALCGRGTCWLRPSQSARALRGCGTCRPRPSQSARAL